jgi:hypothetical protein
VFGGAAGDVSVSRAFVTELGLGTIRIQNKRLLGLKDRPWSLLGRDVLSRFDLFVIPGQSLSLRPRADAHISAPTRIARWGSLVGCERPGCLTARLQPEGTDAMLQLTLERGLERSGLLLLACEASASAAAPPRGMAELLVSGTIRGPFRHIVVRHGGLKVGSHSVSVPHAAALWFADASACTQLTVLDVIPDGNGARRGAGLSASLRP